MDIKIIIALIIVVPVILFPAAFVWYLNIGGMITAIRELAKKRQKVTNASR